MLQQFLPLGKLSVEMQPYTVTHSKRSQLESTEESEEHHLWVHPIAPAYLQQEMLTGLSAGLSFM